MPTHALAMQLHTPRTFHVREEAIAQCIRKLEEHAARRFFLLDTTTGKEKPRYRVCNGFYLSHLLPLQATPKTNPTPVVVFGDSAVGTGGVRRYEKQK